ncbi:MAG: CRISPR-associated protein Cas4 [Candidatus Aenigmatarchaeota archaeon]
MSLQTNKNFFQNSERVEIDLEMLIGGVKVNYYFHCKTQLWLFSRFITQEQNSDLVILGKLLEGESFKEIKTKNVLIDQKISIDFLKHKEGLTLYDVKKSSKFYQAHYFQIAYYLWYLKNVKGIEKIKGIITYPKEHKKVEINLTPELEKEIENALENINQIISKTSPPKSEKKKYCRKCSYFEFCWVNE